jgi:hypothetical protein
VKVTLLALLLFVSATSFAQAPTETTTTSSLGDWSGRDWYIDPATFLSLTIADKYKSDSGSTDNEKGISLTVEGGRNLGRFEVGGTFAKQSTKDDSLSMSSTIYGFFGRFNFIENVDGNNLIPFVRADLRLGSTSFDFSSASSTDYTRDSRSTYLRGGVTYFPFGKFLAIEPYILHAARDYDRSSGTDYEWNGLFFYTALKVYL